MVAEVHMRTRGGVERRRARAILKFIKGCAVLKPSQPNKNPVKLNEHIFGSLCVHVPVPP